MRTICIQTLDSSYGGMIFNSSMEELSEADRNFQEVTIEIRL